MIGTVHECLASTLAERDGQPYKPGRALLINSSHGRIDGCCYLVFREGASRPEYIVKCARTPSGKSVFRCDYENLQRLQQAGMNVARPTVPEPIGTWERNAALITAQSALPGKLLANLPPHEVFSEHTIDATLDRLFDWWRWFHGRMGVRRAPVSGAVYEQAVLDPVSQYRTRFLLDSMEEGLLERRFARERRLLGCKLPFMVMHGDFVAANMMLGPEGISVFDWEFPLVHQLPLFDLFVFFDSFRFPRSRGGEDSHFSRFKSVYWGTDGVSATVQDRLRAVCGEFGVPREALADLFLLALIRQANMKYDAMLTASGWTEGPRAANEDRGPSARPPDMNTPLARIQDGVFENVRYVANHGLPAFTD